MKRVIDSSEALGTVETPEGRLRLPGKSFTGGRTKSGTRTPIAPVLIYHNLNTGTL